MDASKDDKSSGSIPSTRSSRISQNSYLNSLEREYVGGGRTKPPQDRRKPPHPYTRGTSFSITRHKPGEPFGYLYEADNRPRPKRAKGLSTMSQYEYCLANPSLGGTTDSEHRTITITEKIRVGDGCEAQIVRVNNGMVAKFYDPVYYPTLDEYGWVIRDIVTDAEEDYRNEANTFGELQGKFDGTITPKYYGSWTLDIPVDSTFVDGLKVCSKRAVRLVLMEYLNGRSMLDIDPTKLSENERLNILFKAIEAEHTLWLHGITHCDFYPHNIMICGEAFGSPDIRICIIDFNPTRLARFESDYFHKGEMKIPKNRWRLPISPITTWWGGLHDFAAHGWIPFDGYHPNRIGKDELWDRYHDSPLYLPIFRNPEDPYGDLLCPEDDAFREKYRRENPFPSEEDLPSAEEEEAASQVGK